MFYVLLLVQKEIIVPVLYIRKEELYPTICFKIYPKESQFL